MKKNINLIIVTIILTIILCSCGNKQTSETPHLGIDYGEHNGISKNVSLINLIATPEKYDGIQVNVVGVFLCEMESHTLFLTKDDYEIFNTRNGIALDIDSSMFANNIRNLKELNGKYVMIEGVFQQKKEGDHISHFTQGHIKNINRIGEY